MCVCVCVCVCRREKERERERGDIFRQTDRVVVMITHIMKKGSLVFKNTRKTI